MTDVHLRWSLFSPPGEVALCHGDPPRNKPGNPRRLTYAVASHEGGDRLESSFLSLIEAYDGVRVVNSAEEVEVSGAARALKVHLPGDRVDTLVFGDGDSLVEVDGRIKFDGSLGVYSEANGLAQWAVLTGGTVLGTDERSIRESSGVWRGRVEACEPGGSGHRQGRLTNPWRVGSFPSRTITSAMRPTEFARSAGKETER